MKKILLMLLVCVGVSNAFLCETGWKSNQEFVQGGYYVTYSFSNGKTIGIKYSNTETIQYSIRFDFASMEICR